MTTPSFPATSRTVVVTGCSSGIGLATAVELARAGWTVVATLRDPRRGDALRAAVREAGLTVDVAELDVTDDASVAACLSGVVARHGHLDALVNNAGQGHLGTLEQEELAAFTAVIDLNLVGTARVTRAALPLLRASAGRVVSVTSVGGVVGQPFNEAYCAAKFGVEGLMESLAPLAASVGVHVAVVEPGAVASAFVANVGVENSALAANPGPYAPALAAYRQRTAAAFAAAQEPVDVAAVVRRALEDPHPLFRYPTSAGSAALTAVKLADTDGQAVQAFTRGWLH